MKKQIVIAFLSALTTSALAADASVPALIPVPQKLESRLGVFKLSSSTRILVDDASKETGKYFAGQVQKSTGYPFQLGDGVIKPLPENIIVLTQDASVNLGPEGYDLTVAPDSVVIRAATQTGLFYGVQSLLQLAPPEIFSAVPSTNVDWQIPCVHIEDQPRFKWRGLMLDVSRHFFTKDEVKRLLDEMALHKINIFHWHLVDDGGWRIEIKKYPKLTEVGAWRAGVGFGFPTNSTTAYGPDGRYGGFYTQADIREVIACAAERHITIVPEIEMPGHSVAALTAHPEFSCTGIPYSPQMAGGVLHGVYCAGKDETFAFLQDVLSEVCRLFPGKDIHIGGDEVPKDHWKNCPRCQARMKDEGLKTERELQSWFIRRTEKFISGQGKNLIGWSEIRDGGLAPNAVVMDWIGGGREAASEGHDVVMTPTQFCYFDYYQSTNRAAEPRAIGRYVPLSRVYSFEPVPTGLSVPNQKHILGSQGNVWTEYIPNFRQVEYMTFPRLCALAEVTWSPRTARNWEDFQRRLQIHNRRLDVLGVNYRRSTPDNP